MSEHRPPRPHRKKTPLVDSSNEWRTVANDDAITASSSSRSSGIAPSHFHRHHENETNDSTIQSSSSQARLSKALSDACTSVIKQRRSQVTTHLKLRRAAFKELTSLKTWPLQDMALRDLDYWQRMHGCNDDDDDKKTSAATTDDPQFTTATTTSDCVIDASSSLLVENHGDSTGLSSSSLDEPKRARRQLRMNNPSSTSSSAGSTEEALSPRKSTMRHQFKLELLHEQQLPAGIGVDKSDESVDFQPALWCMEPRIFSIEKSNQGKRKYIVGHMGRFCDYYWRKTDARSRHFYELIREKTPCRLYFDLEFSKGANPDMVADGDDDATVLHLLDEFYAELVHEFQRRYAIAIDRSCIVDLDSSTVTKFSRHWIVHLPDKSLFADAVAVGRFVRTFIGRLADEQATGRLQETRPALAKYLFVNVERKNERGGADATTSALGCSESMSTVPPSTDNALASFPQWQAIEPIPTSTSAQTASTEVEMTNKNKVCFVDLGVYTRNRLFRLLGSSKFGKPSSAALRIAATNTFAFPTGFSNESFYVPVMEKSTQSRNSVGENDVCDKRLDMEDDIKNFLSAVDWTDHARALADTLVVPMNGTKIDFPILQDSADAKALDVTGKVDPAVGQDHSSYTVKVSTRPGVGRRMSSNGVGASPFPSIDEFVLKVLAKRGGVEGSIRAWAIEKSSEQLDDGTLPRAITYQMSRNRWCERIGRAHRSNNIMWTVDFVAMSCTQSCHDPECRMTQFRGVPVPLPDAVREAIEEAAFEHQLALLDEQTLLKDRREGEDVNRAAQQEDEFDEAQFEKALLALNI